MPLHSKNSQLSGCFLLPGEDFSHLHSFVAVPRPLCPGAARSLNNTDCKFVIGILEGIWKESCTTESMVSAIADYLDLM